MSYECLLWTSNCLMKTTEAFVYARYLAEFAALEPRELENWRRKHPDFVPDTWWGYRPDSWHYPGDKKLWQFNQECLMEAWQKRFNIGQFELMRLLLSVFEPDDSDMGFLGNPNKVFVGIGGMVEELYPHQQAVLYLKENPWRARFCQRCGTPFVAESNQQKYCHRTNEENQTCASLARTEQKSQDHARHKKDRNRKQRKAYAHKRALLTASKMH